MKRLWLVTVLAACAAEAKTVAWYRMDGAPDGVQDNAAAPATLPAKPLSLYGTRETKDAVGLPTAARGFPAGWQVFDPVAGTRHDNAAALHFNGRGLGGSPGGALAVADDPALHLTTFTLEMFVRFDAREPTGKWWQALAVKPGELPGLKTDSWGLRITDRNKLVARFSAPGGVEPRPPMTLEATGVALDDGAWHHVALVMSDASAFFVRLYVDYVLYAQHWIEWPVWYGPTPLLIGGNLQTPAPVRGTIDEVRLSGEALEPAQFLRPVPAVEGASAPPELAALLKGFEDSKNPATRSRRKERESITWKRLLEMDPGLAPLGRYATRPSREIRDSKWSVGCETLDRDYAEFRYYAPFVGELGVKRARLFSGWAKTEKEKGVYDFAWLDEQVRGLAEMGVKPWICLSYGNPVYGSGLNLGAGVAGVMGNPEGRAAWLKYCGEVVKRYRDTVTEWEIWNEPFGKQMEPYSEMLIETAAVIRGVQPGAVVMASAVGSFANNEKVLALLEARGRSRAIDCWHYHPYIPNPDERKNGWWGYDCVERLRALARRYNPEARVVQGEVGCPAQLEYGHALSDRPWTEYTQAKWTLRRMLGEAVRGIPYNVFSMVDLQYKDYMLQSFGLLRMNLAKRFVYRRPSYHAVRNVVNLLDCDSAPVGLTENVPFTWVKRADIRETGSRRLSVARFTRLGKPLAFVWYADRIPDDSLEWDRIAVELPVAFAEPVWMDVITGRVCAIPSETVEHTAAGTRFAALPVWDAPVLVAERAALPLE